MATMREALEHFKTLADSEVHGKLGEAQRDAGEMQSKFIKAGAGGDRMEIAIALEFARHLPAVRSALAKVAVERLSPFAEHANAETLATLREAVLRAFDLAAMRLRAAFMPFASAGLRFGATDPSGRAGQEVLQSAQERERKVLEAEIALAFSRPGSSAGSQYHRLAAILSTDIVGFSTLMAADEKSTLEAVSAATSTVQSAIERNGGRLVKTIGDGTLSEFPSAVGAMTAALEIQTSMLRANAARPESRRVTLRVGLAVGDVFPDGDDIMGDSVNLAARLQAEAAPGTICTLVHVRDDLANKIQLSSEELGARQLKGIARPVLVVQIVPR